MKRLMILALVLVATAEALAASRCLVPVREAAACLDLAARTA